MIRTTLPIVRKTLIKYRTAIFGLVVLSVILGIIPTLKSELESGVINEINSFVSNSPDIETSKMSQALEVELSRFGEDQLAPQDSSDLTEKLAFALFKRIKLRTAILYYVVIALISYYITVAAKRIEARVRRRVFAALRGEGLRRGLMTDPSSLPTLPNIAGQYAMAIHQGAINVSNTYGYVLEAGQHIFSLATTIFLVATRSVVFAISCLALVLLQVIISVLQARRLELRRRDLDTKRNNLVARTDDILSKREIILAYEQQDRYGSRLDELTFEYAEVGRILEVLEMVYRGLSSLITDYGRLLILLVGLAIALYLDRSAVSNVGDAYFLISIYVRIFVPASNLLTRYDSIKRSASTSRTFLDVLAYHKSEEESEKSIVTPAGANGENIIEFSEVWFRYGSQDKYPWVLQGCSFRVPRGHTTLVLGRSGSGKTTIARVLLGFWPVAKGGVLVDRLDLKNWSGEDLRARMSYVSQGDHIVDDSVRDNLSWGYSRKEISDSEMLRVLDELGIHEENILDKPAKHLSTGQEQRLSVARMMLDESDIVIIDEPLSGVDVFTFRELMPHLTKVLRDPNRTVLMFSHRLAFAAYASHLVVLGDAGDVLEEGDPIELVREDDGIFAQLYAAALAELQIHESSH